MPAQAEQQHRRGPGHGLAAAAAGAVAGVVVVRQDPRRPPAVGSRRRRRRSRPMRRRHRPASPQAACSGREVEGEVQAVGADVGGRPLGDRARRRGTPRRPSSGRRRSSSSTRPDARAAASWVRGSSWSDAVGDAGDHLGGSSGSAGSLPMQWMTSARKPSTPRSSQNRSTSCMRLDELRVRPVEVGLLGQEQVQVPAAASPGRRSRPAAAAGTGTPGSSCWAARRRRGPAVAPDVEVRVLAEPRVLDRGVVRDPVEQDPEAPVVGLGDEGVGVGQGAEDRVDVAVVADVVAEVGHRATGRSATARWRRRRARPGGRAGCGARRGRRRRRRCRRRRNGGRSGRRPPRATTCAETLRGATCGVTTVVLAVRVRYTRAGRSHNRLGAGP